MSRSTTAINLAELPQPDAVRQETFEEIMERLVTRYMGLYPPFSANVESDPVYKILELMAHELQRFQQKKMKI